MERHEFERTVSFQEAAKSAWEAGAKASLKVEYAGIGGAVEAYGKYGEELSRGHAEGSTERDIAQETLDVTGPATFILRAYRSRNKESRVVKARCDFDGKIYWQTGNTYQTHPTCLLYTSPSPRDS